MSPNDSDESLLDPNYSPAKPRQGVRRLNNFPTAIVAAGGILFLLGIGYAVLSKMAEFAGRSEETEVTPALSLADQLIDDQVGIVPENGPVMTAASTSSSLSLAEALIAKANKTPEVDDPARPQSPSSAGNAGSGTVDDNNDNGVDQPRAADQQALPAADSDEGTRSGWAANNGEPKQLTPEQAEEQQFRKELLRQRVSALQKSVNAPTNVAFKMPGAPVDKTSLPQRLAAVQRQIDSLDDTSAGLARGGFAQKLAMLKEQGLLPQAPAQAKAEAAKAAQDPYAAFGGKEGEDRWTSSAKVVSPKSPYMVLAGATIPCTLETPINSDLPGPIRARISRNVYDTATHRYLLLPQGAVVVGEYNSGVVFGQSRALVAWQMIRFPNGDMLDIGAMPGTDAMGRAGFEDQVDNHLFRIFSGAILMSLVSAGVGLSQPAGNAAGGPSFSGALSESLGQQIGQVSAELIKKNMNVKPTLDIREGYLFNIFAKKSLTLNGPYRQ